MVTSAAEAATERKAFIAALKSAAPPQIRAFPQAVEAVPFKNHFNFENQFEKLIRSALACSANLLDSGFWDHFFSRGKSPENFLVGIAVKGTLIQTMPFHTIAGHGLAREFAQYR